MITGVEALAAPEGNYRVMRTAAKPYGSHRVNSNRREFLAVAGAASVAGFVGFNGGREAKPKDMSKLPLAGQRSTVAVVKAASYSKDLADAMLRGILECELDVAGKTVLLKPNFVEFDPNTCINTDVAVVATALEVFRSLGAADVKIGEGPGHRRDTFAIAELTRYRSEIPKLRRCVRGSESRRCDRGQGLRGPRRVLLSE